MSLVKKIKHIFTGGDPVNGKTDSVGSAAVEPAASPEGDVTGRPVEEPSDNFPERPKERRVIQAPTIQGNGDSPQSDNILIKAQPAALGDQCVFMVNRALMQGYSWFFSSFENAADSSLAEAVFSIDDVESVLVLESTLTVVRKDKTIVDWRPLAAEVGAAVRKVLERGGPLIADKIISGLPSEKSIREDVQKVIDAEVNPGVAGHGGHITLMDVTGNSVTIQMGGGCQGCSAADLTLKQGIHSSFRNAVPKVGAILDETDHSAGTNPYFS